MDVFIVFRNFNTGLCRMKKTQLHRLWFTKLELTFISVYMLCASRNPNTDSLWKKIWYLDELVILLASTTYTAQYMYVSGRVYTIEPHTVDILADAFYVCLTILVVCFQYGIHFLFVLHVVNGRWVHNNDCNLWIETICLFSI